MQAVSFKVDIEGKFSGKRSYVSNVKLKQKPPEP
jgi:hypothetical protein